MTAPAYPDVIRWLLDHLSVHAGYLIDAPDDPTSAQAAELARTSCDISISHVCAAAHVDGHRLTAAFYSGDRAMRESGFDPSFRFGPLQWLHRSLRSGLPQQPSLQIRTGHGPLRYTAQPSQRGRWMEPSRRCTQGSNQQVSVGCEERHVLRLRLRKQQTL